MHFSKQHTSVGLELLRVSRRSTLEPLWPLSNPGSTGRCVTHPSATLQLRCESWMGRTGNRRPQPWMSSSPEVHVAFVLELAIHVKPKYANTPTWMASVVDLGLVSLTSSFLRYTLQHHEIERMFCPILVKKRWFTLGKGALARSYLEGCRINQTCLGG